MMNFGQHMTKKNKIVEEYIAEMDDIYKMNKELQDKYNNACVDLPELTDFNFSRSLEFTRTWEIIKTMEIAQRNIYLLFLIAERKYKKMIQLMGNEYKNESTLRVLVCNARKIIKNKYKELYGD